MIHYSMDADAGTGPGFAIVWEGEDGAAPDD